MKGEGEPGLEGQPGHPGVGGGGEGGQGGQGGRGGRAAPTTGWRRFVVQVVFALTVFIIPITVGFIWIDTRETNRRAEVRADVADAARKEADRRDEISCQARLVIIENQQLILKALINISVTRQPLLPEVPTEAVIRQRLANLNEVSDRGC